VSEPAPRRVFRQYRGDLREREDEDQVEEELERRNGVLALGVPVDHSRTLARTVSRGVSMNLARSGSLLLETRFERKR